MKTKECKMCKKETLIKELEENAKCSYGAVCNKCSDEIDYLNDCEQQDR